MILKKKIRQKKMSTLVNFSNPWPGLLEWKHYTWRNHEVQSLGNETLKVKKNLKKIKGQ
jgi:hypothetical protein